MSEPIGALDSAGVFMGTLAMSGPSPMTAVNSDSGYIRTAAMSRVT